MAEESYDDATPSQQVLDAQTQGQNTIAAAALQGRLSLAKQQVMEAVQQGGDQTVGRALLGRLDAIVTHPDYDDPEQLYQEFTQYVRQGPMPARQPAGQSAAARPAKKAIDKDKARKAYADGTMTTSEAQKLGIV